MMNKIAIVISSRTFIRTTSHFPFFPFSSPPPPLLVINRPCSEQEQGGEGGQCWFVRMLRKRRGQIFGQQSIDGGGGRGKQDGKRFGGKKRTFEEFRGIFCEKRNKKRIDMSKKSMQRRLSSGDGIYVLVSLSSASP